MKPTGMAAFYETMLDKPSIVSNKCAVCGKYATNQHHVVQKGMGGVSAEVEKSIPKITLCGSGTTGCHGDVHAGRLHIMWCDGLGGWVYHRTPRAVNHIIDWNQNRKDYRPLPMWIEQRYQNDVIGRKS